MNLPETTLETTRAALRELDLSSSGLDLSGIRDGQLDKIANAVAGAVARMTEQDRPETPPEPPAGTFEPAGVARCPRCGVYRGVETIRKVDTDEDPANPDDLEACFVCVPPTPRERNRAARRAEQLAEIPETAPVDAPTDVEPDVAVDDDPAPVDELGVDGIEVPAESADVDATGAQVDEANP